MMPPPRTHAMSSISINIIIVIIVPITIMIPHTSSRITSTAAFTCTTLDHHVTHLRRHIQLLWLNMVMDTMAVTYINCADFFLCVENSLLDAS